MTSCNVKWLPKPLRINNFAAPLSSHCVAYSEQQNKNKVAAAALKPTQADWMLKASGKWPKNQSKQETGEKCPKFSKSKESNSWKADLKHYTRPKFFRWPEIGIPATFHVGICLNMNTLAIST